jgi:hypothetical protein
MSLFGLINDPPRFSRNCAKKDSESSITDLEQHLLLFSDREIFLQ